MTLYLTEHEELTLKEVGQTRQRPVTQLVQEAIAAWLDRLLDPPAVHERAKFDAIMQEDRKTLQGYLCTNGHTFWIDAWEGKDPLCCPLCVNNTKVKRTWEGTIQRRAFRAGK